MTMITQSPYYREFYQKQGTAVQGTWAWGNTGEPNYASVTGEGTGAYHNATTVDLDEYKWSNIFLTKGTYKIYIAHDVGPERGIAEVLFGVTSLATKDMYAIAGVPTTWEFTFTLIADQTADLRYRVNGKNAAGAGYHIVFSRFQMEKTG